MDTQQPIFSTIDARSVHQRVYEEIRKGLAQGYFSSGQSLTIRGLATTLGTSEMPVREAIKRLVAEKVILQMSNRSFQVPLLSWTEFEEIIEVRVAVEGMAVQRAVSYVDDHLLNQLTRSNSRMKEALLIGDHASMLKSNQEFHFGIYAASKSSIVTDIIQGLWLRSGPYLSEAISNIDGGKEMFLRATEIHSRVVDGLREKDASAAYESLRQDLIETARWYEGRKGGRSH